jgi:hypothetical protein
MLSIEHQPIAPFAQQTAWTANLRQVRDGWLQLCPSWPKIAARFDAWWAHACVDRPIFIGSTAHGCGRAVCKHTDLLLGDEMTWFETKKADMLALHRAGDALPNLRVDFGPVLLGGLLGGRMEFEPHTCWTHPMIDDAWSNAPDGTITANQGLWRRLRNLMELVSADAAGHYLVCTPDLGGSADVLLNLRGSAELCIDVVERPLVVKQAIDAVYDAWRQAFAMLYDVTSAYGAGLLHWLEIWSSQPYMIPACDFNYMVSPAVFNDVCLPDIARQAATVGRGVFHLDGPGATRHIDALLEVPSLDAIQFVPGSGAPSLRPWLDMLRQIQDRGRSLIIAALADEVLDLCDALRPEGLAFMVQGTPRDQMDQLYEALCHKYGCDA